MREGVSSAPLGEGIHFISKRKSGRNEVTGASPPDGSTTDDRPTYESKTDNEGRDDF